MADNRESVLASTVSQRSYDKTTFDSVLILTDKATFPEPFRVYQSSTGFLEDNTHDDLVQAGLLLFMQEPKIVTVIVAKTDDTNTDVGTLGATMVDLDAILDTDFFAVTVVSDHTDDQLIELAKFVETQEFMFCAYTANPLVIALNDTDLASRVKALGLRKTNVWYHATKRLDMAFISRFLGEKIGLVSAKFLVLSGIDSSNLSSSEMTNLLNKECNAFDTERKKYTFTKQGTTASGENIKSVAGEIFVSVTSIEAIYEVLLNNSNISFNAKDIRKITTALNVNLRKAQAQKIIAEDDAELGASYLMTLNPLRAESKLEVEIKYLDAGTIKWVTLKFTAFKDDTQFNIEREA